MLQAAASNVQCDQCKTIIGKYQGPVKPVLCGSCRGTTQSKTTKRSATNKAQQGTSGGERPDNEGKVGFHDETP